LSFMTRFVLPLLSVLLVAMASFTVIKAPTIWTWWLALLAAEFGHFFVILPLTLSSWAIFRWATIGPVSMVITVAACALAVGLFFKPTIQAARLAKTLPEKLERTFGPAKLPQAPFSLAALATFGAPAVTPETRVFAHAGKPSELAMDFYRAESVGPAPCVIVVHGGGWDSGERTQLPALNSYLARRGFAVAAVSYRLTPQAIWPAQRDDVRAAVTYLKTHAQELGIDSTRFVLLGRSAGGQIAEAVAYDEPDPAIRGVVALYAPADLHFAWKFTNERDVLDSKKLIRQLTGGTPETAPAAFDSASPYLYAKRGAVPTLLMHGTIDSLVWRRQSERLDERLRAENVPVVFLEMPWATHAFDVNLHGPGGQLSTFAIEWFTRAVTR
jgi:acetyl esterase/lipase